MDNENNFQAFLNESNNKIFMHQRKLQFLMTKIYKFKNYYALLIMHHLFRFCENTPLRNISKHVTHNEKMSIYELETASYRAPFLLLRLSTEYKITTSPSRFTKKQLERW